MVSQRRSRCRGQCARRRGQHRADVCGQNPLDHTASRSVASRVMFRISGAVGTTSTSTNTSVTAGLVDDYRQRERRDPTTTGASTLRKSLPKLAF